MNRRALLCLVSFVILAAAWIAAFAICREIGAAPDDAALVASGAVLIAVIRIVFGNTGKLEE